METFFFYLLKSSVLLAGFYLVYHFLLQKETFYRANRWFLWLGYLVSLVLPLITFVKKVFVEIPAISYAEGVQASPVSLESYTIDWKEIALVVYGIGLIFFGLRFAMNLMQLAKTIRKYRFQKANKLLVADDAAIELPFSFFRYVFLNSKVFSGKEATFIFKHEQAHAKGYHSVDLLFANLHTVFFWFHPFTWWYRSKINQNLEYLADEAAIACETDKTAYQQTLLKSLSLQANLALTHPFYQSFLKNRIVMMNQEKSPKHKAFKYSLMLPLLVLFFLQFQVETRMFSQNVTQKTEKYSHVLTDIITPETTQYHLQEIEKYYNEKKGFSLQFKNVKRDVDYLISSFDIMVQKEGNAPELTSVGGNDGFDSVVLLTRTNDLINWDVKILVNPDKETFESQLPKVVILDEIKPQMDGINTKTDTTEIHPLIIIDGQILSRKLNRDELNNLIDPKRIESVNILKGEQAIQKYEAKARDGAIEIITKEIPKEHIEKLNQNKAVLQSGQLPENVFYMLNGKYSTKAEIGKLNPDDILSINILKGKNATDKYGSLGKNGVIEIHTKVF